MELEERLQLIENNIAILAIKIGELDSKVEALSIYISDNEQLNSIVEDLNKNFDNITKNMHDCIKSLSSIRL